ncbi:MAG TPA: type II toxin-antitoxin system RelE/ParE family toxin [Pyrinomonadaceae bacterium]|nr:type II toxin-antitoxin system RelE/ParE family toxin [Pyrinomonadaceae bacterium]
MDSYRIEWKRSAIKELKALPKEVVSTISQAVGKLSMNPYPHGVKKLSGSEHTYRIRQGSYRVVFTVTKATSVVEVVRIGHRKDVYDR